jgi:F-type H+-transporting ATPase subunit epsilon
MDIKTFECSVITPEGKVFEGQVEWAVVPAHDGEIGILHNRAPLLCRLGAGRMRVHTEIEEKVWFIDGGFAQVVENQVTVLTQEALRTEEISAEDAQSRLAEALKMPVTDEVSARRRAEAMASARARIRMAR